jgi:hypothetical protein
MAKACLIELEYTTSSFHFNARMNILDWIWVVCWIPTAIDLWSDMRHVKLGLDMQAYSMLSEVSTLHHH